MYNIHSMARDPRHLLLLLLLLPPASQQEGGGGGGGGGGLGSWFWIVVLDLQLGLCSEKKDPLGSPPPPPPPPPPPSPRGGGGGGGRGRCLHIHWCGTLLRYADHHANALAVLSC